jgi:transcriptional regulator with GAF, ATPase, and Fis domain
MSERADGREGPAGSVKASASIARALASSLDWRGALPGVAAAARMVVPFQRMGVSLVEGGDSVRVWVVAGGDAAGGTGTVWPLRQHSSRLWPGRNGPPVCLRDASRELDTSFEADRRLVEAGTRSLLALTLDTDDRQLGALWFDSREADAFTAAHAAAAGPIADLVVMAVEHERLWALAQERRRRRDRLEALLPAIAGALDVRVVFPGMSTVIQEVVPHDVLSLALVTPDGTGARIHAATNAEISDREEYRFSTEHEAIRSDWRYFLAHDVQVVADGVVRARLSPPGAPEPVEVELRPGSSWTRKAAELGVRSTLRVPIRAQDRTIGALSFSSRRPSTYSEDDVELAARIADHVSLALAHERLAEEARRAAEAKEHAARLEERVQVLVHELRTLSPHRALGRSPQWRDVLAQATKVAPTETTVLITGASGTGKEVVARFVHRGSSRRDGPFVALNCAALPEQLLESELFGHEKGAFTGALAARPGRIEQASGGVLFLDEVGEMTLAVQAKFLRVLEEREYQRLGGVKTLKADVRVLAATNRNLKAAIAQSAFREDLYYRLAVFDIALPPLRERKEDILLLVDAFLEEIGRVVGRPAAGVSEEVRESLLAYPWPGNVRELRNAIERAVILCEGGLVTSEHLPLGVAQAPRPEASPVAAACGPGTSAAGTLDAAEREMILQALTRAGHNKSKAARLLGLTRAQLRSRIEKHGLAEG